MTEESKMALKEELEKIEKDGINVEYANCGEQKESVRMTDPDVNSRVSVTMTIEPCDTSKCIFAKIAKAIELNNEASQINAYKAEIDNFEKEKEKLSDELTVKLDKMFTEVLKKSPQPFDFLQANKPFFSVRNYHDLLSPFAKLKPFPIKFNNDEDEEEEEKPRKKSYSKS